jgi:hypothetical protein
MLLQKAPSVSYGALSGVKRVAFHYLGFFCQPFSGASLILASALFWCQQIPGVSKALVSAKLSGHTCSPMLALRDVHLSPRRASISPTPFSRHTCSPCSPFFSRASAFLVLAFFSYQRTLVSPVL